VVDGCSTDDTVGIVKEAIGAYQSIRTSIVSEKDNGIYDAMNKGINYASGEWLYFLGSDDYIIDNEVLSDIANRLNTTSADLLYGNAVVSSDNTSKGGEFSLQKLLTEGNLCHQSVFYKKKVFDLLGKYNLKYPIVADWDFNIRCFQSQAITTEYIARDIVYYNDVSGISSTSRNDSFYNLVPVTYISQVKILENKNKDLLNTAEYKIGKTIYSFLNKIGLVKIFRKIR
jgi:glycosyltransferase involved in cell wall biosynthesis